MLVFSGGQASGEKPVEARKFTVLSNYVNR
jgi:hypothetical protein